MSITRTDIWAALPSTSRGHPIHLSYDKKSNRIVYAANKSIHIRSVDNPEKSIQYTLHNANTTVAKFSPSGFYVASGDASGTVRVWDCAGEDLITKGEYHVISGKINDLSWDADSQRIIAVGDGKEKYGHCFTADSGNTVGEISGHNNVVNAVDIRPVRPYRAATVSDDSSLVFYTGPPFKFDSSIKDKHTNFVHDVRFSPDGTYLVSVSADRKIAVYDGKTGEFQKYIGTPETAHSGSVFSVAWGPDSTKIATASADASVRLWDVASGELIKVWQFPKTVDNQQLGVVFAGEILISLGLSGELRYLSSVSETPVKVIYGHQKAITALTVSGPSIYTGSYDGRIVNWDIKTGESKLVEGDGHNSLVVSLLNSGSAVWSTAWDDTLKAISGLKFKDNTTLSLGAQPVAAASDGDLIAVVTEHTVALYDGAKGSKIAAAKLNYVAKSVAVSAKAGIVAIGRGSDNGTTLLSVSDLSPVSGAELPKLSAVPSHASFSPNGELLAVGDVNGKIMLYSIADRDIQTSRWVMHTSRINSIAWHPSGQYVATGSLDTNVYIYSVKTPGKIIKTLGAHKEGVNAVGWADENTVVTTGNDATVKLWAVKFH